MAGQSMRTCFHMAVWPLLLIALALPAPGQGGRGKGRVTGTVMDEAGLPIKRAKIVLLYQDKDGGTFETTTDPDGRWSYNGLATGNWNATASADGYHSANRDIYVRQLSENPKVLLTLEKLKTGLANESASALLEKANELYYARQFDEALGLYRRFLQIEPADELVALSIGYCLQEKGDLDAAVAQFKAIADRVAKDPRDHYVASKAWTGLAECAMKKNDPNNAREFYKQAFALAPEEELLAYNIGEIYFNERNAGGSIPYYLEACRIAPAWSDPLFKLGTAYLNVGDFGKAREAFARFLATEPKTKRSADARKILQDLEKKRN